MDREISIQQKLPKEILYSKIAPKGYPCVYKQWINDPLTGNKTWARNDIVRFNFMNSKRGTFDPYRSFLEITVSVDINDMPVGLLQIDNSAHSFINQMVLYSNNRQIERITQYSSLLAYLNDIGMNEFLSQGRQAQGLGYGCHDTMPYYRADNLVSQTARPEFYSPTDIYNSITMSNGHVFPTIGNNYPIPTSSATNNCLFNSGKTVKGHLTNANQIIFPQDHVGGTFSPNTTQNVGYQKYMDFSLKYSGYATNFRTQYMSNIVNGKFPQSPQSIPNWETKLPPQIANGTFPFTFSKQKPYQPIFSLQKTTLLNGSGTGGQFKTPINCALEGFTTLFSPFFTKGAFQPFISPTVPQLAISNGVITKTKLPIFRKRFKIPLASAVIGCLIDPNNYCLIPLQSINDVLLQLTLDQYAMFTSGYNDVSQLDNVGIKIQQFRCWNVERIQYKLHTYFFIDNQIEQYIKASLYKEIILVNNFWALGNQYQIQGGSLVNDTYIVGCSSTHLNQIVCLFVSNDYQKYSFCRKHFRLSNNIRRFWSKLAVDYWPPQPFKGNGGNICSNAYQDDNTIFIQNLYWANNYMFSKNSLPRINSYNFAINQRAYNPTNTQTFYNQQVYNNPKYEWTEQTVNADTALGMPYIHQNRFIGKAAYAIVYTPFTSQNGLLQGINVSGLSTFEVVFETDSTQVFPRDQTLYIFCKSSVIVKYSKDGIITIGR